MKNYRLIRSLKMLIILTTLLAVSFTAKAQSDNSPQWSIGQEFSNQGQPVKLYAQADTSSTILTELPVAASYELHFGPKIFNGVNWWYVVNGYGWIPQEIQGEATFALLSDDLVNQVIQETTAAIESNA